jgi:hypothetical protein
MERQITVRIIDRLDMGGSQQQHFLMCVFLMLLFFAVSQVEQFLYAMKITSILVGGDDAHTAYLLFSGIAVGILRGMFPDSK